MSEDYDNGHDHPAHRTYDKPLTVPQMEIRMENIFTQLRAAEPDADIVRTNVRELTASATSEVVFMDLKDPTKEGTGQALSGWLIKQKSDPDPTKAEAAHELHQAWAEATKAERIHAHEVTVSNRGWDDLLEGKSASSMAGRGVTAADREALDAKNERGGRGPRGGGDGHGGGRY